MGIIEFLKEFISLLTINNIILMTVSSGLGIVIGALPGLSATMGIALLTGLTFSFSKVSALIILMGVYVGAIYGGSISAILINVPGTGSAAATALDGHQLALKGRTVSTIKITRIASVIGTVIGMLCLATITPLITKIALNFTSAEFFLLALFGILICGSVSAYDLPIKGWIAGILGIQISMIGIDPLNGVDRFTFGIVDLMSGVSLIPAMIGFFAFPTIIKSLKNGDKSIQVIENQKDDVNILGRVFKNLGLIVRSSIIGVSVGSLPGVGENVAAWLSYDNAQKTCKNGKEFGTGVYEGVIAPEVANNAAIGGALIPLLSLAVPGSPPAAVLLGALMLHGIRPGPMLNFEFPGFTFQLASLILLATIMIWLVGSLLARPMASILKIPATILMPIVGALGVIGAYALNLSSFDLTMLFIFGIIGYVFDMMGYPSAAIILGILLGNLLDENFRRTLMVSGGNIIPFVTRPICIIFVIAIIYTIVGPYISNKFRNISQNAGE